MSVQIEQLEIDIKSNGTLASKSIDKLSSSLSNLSKTINQISTPTQKLRELVDALKPLGNIGKTNLGSTLKQLSKIPEITKALDTKTLSEFANKIRQVTDAVRPLATEMEKVSLGFSRLPANIQRAINANAKLTTSNAKLGGSFRSLGLMAFISNIKSAYYAVQRLARVMGGWITESMAYVENLNLFYVAMGKYANAEKAFAERASEAFGLDPSQFMRYQAIFMNMATGFGIAGDKAVIMSRNLTQMGYDLASVFNVNFDTAMEKLQSGISGQPRPMREWGFDLSEATLKTVALKKGIDKNVESMTQFEKSQLRYVQLLETAQRLNLTGDLARTLEAPANQVRVLQANLTQAGRALGNIFIPALNAALPYLIAFLKVVRTTANEIANLFGFTLPEIDYSGLSTVATDAEDATDAVKELKNAMLGIDELNILNPASASTSNLANELDLDLPEYNFFDGLITSRFDELAEKFEKPFKDALSLVVAIGAGIAAWTLSKSVYDLFSTITKMGVAGSISFGVTLALVGFTISSQGAFNIGAGNADIGDYIKTAVGSALGIAASLIVFGTGPVGWAVGIAAAIAVSIASFAIGYTKSLKDLASEAFAKTGEGGASPEDVLEAFQEYYDTAFGADNKITIDLGFEVNRSGLSDFIEDLQIVDSYLFGENAPTEAQIEEIKTIWGSVSSTMESVFDTSEKVILSTFTKPFSDAAASIGKDAMVMRAQFLALSGEMSAGMAALTAESEALAIKISFGTASDADLEKYKKIRAALQEQNIKDNPLVDILKEFETIDFSDFKKLTVFLENINESISEFETEMRDAYDTEIASVEDYMNAAKIRLELGDIDRQQYNDVLDYFASYKDTLNAAYQAQEQEINNAIDDIWKKVSEQIETGIQDVQDKAFEKWNSLPFWKQELLGSLGMGLEYSVNTAVNEYLKELKELETRASKEYISMGIDLGSTWAQSFVDAANQIFAKKWN